MKILTCEWNIEPRHQREKKHVSRFGVLIYDLFLLYIFKFFYVERRTRETQSVFWFKN